MTDSRPLSIPTASIQRGIQTRKNDLDRIDAQSVKHYKLSGRTQAHGSGESSITVTFPVTFTDMPAFSQGAELAKNQVPELTGGALPTANAMVATWTKIESEVPGHFFYTGATLVIVTKNNPRYIWVHWHMDGKAFRNPIFDLSVDDPLAQ